MNINTDKIKLVVSDLDGTIIPEGTQDFEPGFFEVLDALLDKGIGFMAASGRTYASMRRRFDKYADRMVFLCENGALVMKNEEAVFKKIIPFEASRAISTDLLNNPNVDVQLSGTNCCYLKPRSDWYYDNMKNKIKNNVSVIETFDDIPEPILKIAAYIYDFEKNAPGIRSYMMEHYGAYGDFVYAGNDFLDLLPNDTGKGPALAEYMKETGLTPEEIIVFGDNENDMSMLSLSPNSYAKANSAPNVKASAGHECASVTAVLRELFL